MASLLDKIRDSIRIRALLTAIALFVIGPLLSFRVPMIPPWAEGVGWIVAACFGAYAIEPFFRQQIFEHLPMQWLAPDVLNAWHWYLYKPRIKTVPRLESLNNGIWLFINIEVPYPFGESHIDFDKSYVLVNQDGNQYRLYVTQKPKAYFVNTWEEFVPNVSYFLRASDLPAKFAADKSFRWEIRGINASLQNDDGPEISGHLPKFGRVKRGRE